jgi:ABC-type multidrug transport system fused ATPase/permease subunit
MSRLLRPYLFTYLWPLRARALLLAALLLASIGLQLASPQLLRRFIDTAREGASNDALLRLAVLFFGVVLLGQLAAAAVLYLGTDVGWAATNILRADLLAHVLGLDMRFHNAHTPGELIQRVDGDVAALANFFSQFVVRILGSLLLVVGIVLLLIWEDWRLGLALAGIAVLGLLALQRLQRVAVPLVKAHRQSLAALTGFWEERLLGTEDIRTLGAQPYVMRRHFELLGEHMRRARLGNTSGRIMQSAGELLIAIGTAVAFTFGAYLLYGGTLTIGTIYLVFAYTDLLAWNILAIATQLDDLQQASAGIERIHELRSISSPLPDTGRARLPDTAPELAFEDVCFGYGEGTPALAHISFTLAPGATLGVLGRTGSGKTTLSRLLFRFYDPSSGRIRLDGTDLRELRLRELRRRIDLVTQDVQLFHASVRDNLTLFDAQIDDARILAALEEFGLDSWFQRLPDGLDSLLAPGGGGMSAGEAQLLAFTRVFLRNPTLVILDEASSRLDPATERMIGHATERLLHGRTAIVIAHRLTTVEQLDQILILEQGHVLEHGRRVALRDDPRSRFALLRRTGLGEVLV